MVGCPCRDPWRGGVVSSLDMGVTVRQYKSSLVSQ